MKKNKQLTLSQKLIASFNLFLISFFYSAKSVSAQITNPVTGNLGVSDPDAPSGSRFIQYVVYLWRASVTLGSLAVIVFFLLGAFTWITAGGDTSKIEQARNQIMNSVVGLVLLVSSFVLLSFLSKLLFAGEFDIFQLSLPGTDN